MHAMYDGPCTRGREAKEVLQLERVEQGGQGPGTGFSWQEGKGSRDEERQASLPVLLSPLNLLDAFAQLSLESLILRMEDSTMSPLT